MRVAVSWQRTQHFGHFPLARGHVLDLARRVHIQELERVHGEQRALWCAFPRYVHILWSQTSNDTACTTPAKQTGKAHALTRTLAIQPTHWLSAHGKAEGGREGNGCGCG
jgi:hypothetical protein